MKFTGLREFRAVGTEEIFDVVKYLAVDLVTSLRELTNGLRRLSFADNFDSFQDTVTIASGAEARIRNQLDSIPTGYLKIKSNPGGVNVVDGDTEWTNDFVYLKNSGATSATVTAVFLK